jgi:hypothetical protein
MPNLPTKIETPDDYIDACQNFVLPLFFKQSQKIVEVLKELHETIAKSELNQEKIDFYINKIKELSAFANKESPMNPYFHLVANLEERLEEEGLFNEEQL